MDIVCVIQPDGTLKSSPFHVRFGKLKLLKSDRKQVTITVNDVESNEVAMLLGQEGEAFFLREAFQDEATSSIENVSSSIFRQGPKSITSPQLSKSQGTAGAKDSVAGGPRSDPDLKNGSQLLEDFEIGDSLRMKANKHNSSPKSAHHAMGLEAAHFNEDLINNEDGRSPKKEDFGKTVEEQRKGLWRSIFGYFRGPKKTEVQAGTTSTAKSEKPAEATRSLQKEESKQIEREFDVNVDDLGSMGYDSEDRSSDSQKLKQDSEIHMSLCLHAFKALEPTNYCEMKELFDQFRVPYEQMCSNPHAVMKDPNLVVQIERNFYTWENGAPMIMSCLAYKKPLPPDQIGESLNEQLLPSAQQL